MLGASAAPQHGQNGDLALQHCRLGVKPVGASGRKGMEVGRVVEEQASVEVGATS